MSLLPIEGPLGTKRAAHLLRRVAFGATAEEIATFAEFSVEEAMAVLFAPLEDPMLPIDPPTGITWIGEARIEDVSSGDDRLQEYFKAWWLGLMLQAGSTVETRLAQTTRENIVFFLHTLFTTKQDTVGNSRALFYQQALFRFFARDDREEEEYNLKELTVRVCLDNAMLRFLDGRLNVEGNPNENFARELLELYSVGRGLEGNLPADLAEGDYGTFTEQDVQAGARVLSGWDIDTSFTTLDELTQIPIGEIKGDTLANRHDNSVKQFSERLGNGTVVPDPLLLENGSPTEASARDEIVQLIDLIYNQEETARHICRRLVRYFVQHEITVALDDSLVAELAQVFIDSGYRLEPTIKALLSSEYFFGSEEGVADDKTGALIKSPLDLVVGTVHALGVQYPDPYADPERFYAFGERLIGQLDAMGMPFLNPFEVAGYPAYHQFPLFHRNWISTNYLAQRYNFVKSLLATPMELEEMMGEEEEEYNGVERVDVLAYVRATVPNGIAQNARDLIVHLAKRFLPNAADIAFETAPEEAELTVPRLNYFLNAFLFSPQIDANPEEAWTTRWNEGGDDTLANQLKNLLNAMLQSPEYQLK